MIVSHLLKSGETYQEKGATYCDEVQKQRVERQLVNRLERMGYRVTLEPTAPGA